MKTTFLYSAALALLSFTPATLAGWNCKCQDPSGTGPQWDDLSERVCSYLADEQGPTCSNIRFHADQHHQCSSATGCLDSGEFNDLCASLGAPGAYCWH